MKVLRAPYVRSGERITAKWANDVAGAVNEALRPPKDLDEGVPDGAAAPRLVLREQARSSEEVRIENPEDEEQYVNVDRAQASDVWNPEEKRIWQFRWLNDD